MNADARNTGRTRLVELERLGSLADDDELVRDVVETLLEDVPVQIAKVHEAIASGSADRTQDAVHRLKNGFLYVATDDVIAQLQEVEVLGADGDFDAVRDRMPGVESLVARVLEELESRVRTPAARDDRNGE